MSYEKKYTLRNKKHVDYNEDIKKVNITGINNRGVKKNRDENYSLILHPSKKTKMQPNNKNKKYPIRRHNTSFSF